MPNIVADLAAQVSIVGVAEAQGQLDAFGASLDAAGASGDAASAGIDRVAGSADAAATGLDATATAGDGAATALDAVAGSGDAAAGSLDRVGASGDAAAAGLDASAASGDAAAASAHGVGSATGSANIGILAIAAGGLMAAKSAYGASTAFQTWMQDVYSINPALAANKDMQDQVVSSIKATAAATATDPNSLARAFYYAESAGYSTADAMKVVNQGAKAGIAGMADSVDSTKLLVGTMNAYGLSADQAGTVSDKMFTIVKDGVLRFSDLNENWGKTSTMAAQLGVSIDELGGGFDALTNKGNAPAAAGVQLTSIMTGLLKPTKALKEEFANMGYANGEDMIKQLGFSGAIKELYNATGGDPTMLASFFANKNAMKGLMGLEGGSDQGALYDAQIANMQNSGGNTEEALKAQEAATSFHVKAMETQFQLLAIALGDGIRPVVQVVADVFAKLFGVMAMIPGPILAVVGAVGALVSGFAFLAAGGALLETMLGTTIGAALAGGAASALAVVAPFLLIAGAIYLVYEAFQQNLFGIKDQVINAFNAISNAVSDGIDVYQRMVTFGFNPFVAGLFGISQALNDVGLGGLADFFTNAAHSLKDAIVTFQTFEALGATPFVAALKGIAAFFDGIGWTGIGAAFNKLAGWSQIGIDAFKGLTNALGYAFDGTKSWTDLLTRVPDGLRGFALGLIEVTSGLGRLWRGFTDNGFQGILDAWPAAWTRIAAGLTTFGNALKDTAGQLIGWTLNVGVPVVTGWITTASIDAWSALKTAAGWTGNVLASLTGWTLNTLVPTVTGWVVALAGDAWSALKAAALFTGNVTGDLGAWTLNTLVPTLSGGILTIKNRFGPWLLGEIEAGYDGSVKIGKIVINSTGAALSDASKSSTATSIKDSVVSAIKGLVSFGSDVASEVVAAIGGFSGWAHLMTGGSFDIGAKVGGALHDAIVKGVKALSTANWGVIITDVAGFMLAAALAAPAAMLSVATAIVSGFTGFVVSLIGGADNAQKFKEFATGVLGKIGDEFKKVSWTDVGNDIKDGFVSGVASAWKHLDPEVKGWIHDLLGWFKSALGIASPSTIFAQMGQDVVEGLKNGLDAAWSKIKEWVNTAIDLFKTTFAGGLGKAKDDIVKVFSDIYDKVKGPLGDVKDAITAIKDAWGTVSGFIGGIFGGGGNDGGNVATTGPGSITDPNAGGKENPGGVGSGAGGGKKPGNFLTDLFGGGDKGPVGGVAASFGTIGTDAGNAFNTNLYAGLLKAQNTAIAVWNQMKTDAGTFKTNLTTIATDTGNAFNTSIYQPGLLAAQTTAVNVWNAILKATDTFKTGMTTRATNLGNEFNTNIYVGLLAAQNTALKVWSAMKVDIADFHTDANAKALTIGNDFNTQIYVGLLAAQNTVGNVMTAIANLMGAMGQTAYALGANIGNSLADGISSATGAVIDAAQRLSNAAQVTTQTVNAMHSPSQVYRQFGQYIGQGFALGMDDSRGTVAASAAGMLTAPSFARGSGGINGGGGNTYHVTNHFQIDGSKDPKATAQEVANVLWGQAGQARQMQVGM